MSASLEPNPATPDTLVQTDTASRNIKTAAGLESLNDCFEAEISCRFLRFRQNTDYTLPAIAGLRALPAGGWLLAGEDQAFWLPRLPVARKIDAQGHILEERSAAFSGLDLDSSGTRISLSPPVGHSTDCVIWELPPALVDELTHLSALETQPYFLWGSHTRYAKPADLYLHLIQGWVYENRATWPKYWRVCSENDAHALYVLFSGLERATGKTMYRLFKRQLVLSVLHRQSEDGGWYHGEWTDDMESHFRLHTSALHLLMDAYSEHPDSSIADALDKGLTFLTDRSERLDQSIWFLHDSLETSEAAMRKSPFQWLPSKAFGKSVGNMLVLNTHWDTTVALERADHLLDKPEWRQTAQAANRATLAVLSARPAEWLYRPLFGLIALSFLPTAKAAALPIWRRALKRIGWKYLIPRLHHLKRRFPRLVMPGGFLDRALSLKGVSKPYQSINVMDLVRLQRRFPDLPLKPHIDRAIEFTYRSGLWESWAEDEKNRYAYGFWAEALYHLCLLDPEPDYRRKLAETMFQLSHLGLGHPPSLLGANREALETPPSRNASLLPESLRIADLSRPEKPEILLLNPGEEAVPLNLNTLPPDLEWRDSQGNRLETTEIQLQPKSWIIGE